MVGEMVLTLLGGLWLLTLHISGSGSFPRPLTVKQERECLERLKQGDRTARNELVEHNLRLVAHIVKKYYAISGEQDDLISIGTIGLIKAVESYDLGKKTKFSTYASRCIENEILMYFRGRKKTCKAMITTSKQIINPSISFYFGSKIEKELSRAVIKKS